MRFWEEWFGGHISVGPLTAYGLNAMHVAVQWRTGRWGYVCFHPTVRLWGKWWPWYIYVSPNATPWAATFAVGPGIGAADRRLARVRRDRLGHGFDAVARAGELRRINGYV